MKPRRAKVDVELILSFFVSNYWGTHRIPLVDYPIWFLWCLHYMYNDGTMYIYGTCITPFGHSLLFLFLLHSFPTWSMGPLTARRGALATPLRPPSLCLVGSPRARGRGCGRALLSGASAVARRGAAGLGALLLRRSRERSASAMRCVGAENVGLMEVWRV